MLIHLVFQAIFLLIMLMDAMNDTQYNSIGDNLMFVTLKL
jgi:hypothetical protein